MAAYQELGLKTAILRLKLIYNIYWNGKGLYLYKLWIFVGKKPFGASAITQDELPSIKKFYHCYTKTLNTVEWVKSISRIKMPVGQKEY